MHKLAKNTLSTALITIATVSAAFSQNKAPNRKISNNNTYYAYQNLEMDIPQELESIAAQNNQKVWVRYEAFDHSEKLQIFLTVSAQDGLVSKKPDNSMESEEVLGFNMLEIRNAKEENAHSIATIARVRPDGSVELHHFQSDSKEITQKSATSIFEISHVTPILLKLGLKAPKNKL